MPRIVPIHWTFLHFPILHCSASPIAFLAALPTAYTAPHLATCLPSTLPLSPRTAHAHTAHACTLCTAHTHTHLHCAHRYHQTFCSTWSFIIDLDLLHGHGQVCAYARCRWRHNSMRRRTNGTRSQYISMTRRMYGCARLATSSALCCAPPPPAGRVVTWLYFFGAPLPCSFCSPRSLCRCRWLALLPPRLLTSACLPHRAYAIPRTYRFHRA